MLIISVRAMKTIDERETTKNKKQKNKPKNKKTKTEKNKGGQKI